MWDIFQQNNATLQMVALFINCFTSQLLNILAHPRSDISFMYNLITLCISPFFEIMKNSTSFLYITFERDCLRSINNNRNVSNKKWYYIHKK